MTEGDEKLYREIIICQFCEQEGFSDDKIRDHCHLTGKYRGPTHQKCNIIVKQKQSILITFAFHKFTNYDTHLFL